MSFVRGGRGLGGSGSGVHNVMYIERGCNENNVQVSILKLVVLEHRQSYIKHVGTCTCTRTTTAEIHVNELFMITVSVRFSQ